MDRLNPNDDPGKMGLKVVAEIEYSSGSYEFDTRIVWADKHGQLFTAQDEGCSCPTPFEAFDSIDKLEPVDLAALRREVNERATDGYSGVSAAKGADFIAKVARAIRDPASVRFDQAAYDAQVAREEEDKAIRSGLWQATKALGIPHHVVREYEIAPHVPRDLTPAQCLVLGVFLTNVAEQQLGVTVAPADGE